MTSNELNAFIEPLIEAAVAAGESILHFYENPDQLNIQNKSDKTQVTAADLSANRILTKYLQGLTPEWPIISEEDQLPDFNRRQSWSQYWLLDPLDGTKGFINHLDDFTVNIALIVDHVPVLGVLYVPVTGCCYFGYRDGGAFVLNKGEAPKTIHTQPVDLDEIRFVVGQYHNLKRIQPILDHYKNCKILRVNSSLKFARIAEGVADVYPRFGPINEWDTAAGQAILEAAGGAVVTLDGKNFSYNLRESILCPPFLAVGDVARVPELIDIFKTFSV